MKDIESAMIKSFEELAILTSSGHFSWMIWVMVAKNVIRIHEITFGERHVLIVSHDRIIVGHFNVLIGRRVFSDFNFAFGVGIGGACFGVGLRGGCICLCLGASRLHCEFTCLCVGDGKLWVVWN